MYSLYLRVSLSSPSGDLKILSLCVSSSGFLKGDIRYSIHLTNVRISSLLLVKKPGVMISS